MRIIFVVVLGTLLVACAQDKWEGFVYPDGGNLMIHQNIGLFDSLESCRLAALSRLSSVSSIERGDYECGLNCKDQSGMDGIKVCEKTLR